MALALVVLMGFAAITIDLGMVSIQKGRLQNAIDAAALAAAQSLPDTTAALAEANKYVQLNGFSPCDISVSFSDSNYRVKITATKEIPYTFAKVLGLTEATVSDIASAKKEITSGTFEYALFSGSKTTGITFRGRDHVINGSMHTNSSINFSSVAVTVTGSCEAVKGYINQSKAVLSNPFPNAQELAMPVFPLPASIPGQPGGVTWTTANPGWVQGNVYVIDKPIYFDGNFSADTGDTIRITGNGCIIAKGSVTLGGSAVVVIETTNPVAVQSLNSTVTIAEPTMTGAGSIYAKGNITFSGGPLYSITTSNPVAIRSVNGSITFENSVKVRGSGGIYAYNNIVMRGGSMDISTSSETSMYAQNGYIDFQNTNSIGGVIYAPKSSIKLSGSTCSLKGSLIADTFDIGNTIKADPLAGGGAGGTTVKIKLVE